MDVLSFLSNFSYLLLIIPLAIGMVKRKKLRKEQRLVLVLVAITLVSDSITFYLKVREINNLWVYHFFVPIYFLVLVEIYKQELSVLFSGKVFDIFRGLWIAFVIVNSIWFQPLNTFNSNAITTSSLVYIILSLAYFYRLLKKPLNYRLETTPMFWLNTGVLLYYSGTLVMFILINNFLDEDRPAIINFWALNVFFSILFTGFYIVSLLSNPKE